jgi:hypothetical protein
MAAEMNQKGNKQASRSISGWVYPSATTPCASTAGKNTEAAYA